MRVRPFFWFLLLCTCLSVLTFALLYTPHIPASLQVDVRQQRLGAHNITTVELHLTDPQGRPIDRAQVIPSARMTNMNMWTKADHTIAQGSGKYLVQFRLSMAGPWAITLHANAEGFAPVEQTVSVQVT